MSCLKIIKMGKLPVGIDCTGCPFPPCSTPVSQEAALHKGCNISGLLLWSVCWEQAHPHFGQDSQLIIHSSLNLYPLKEIIEKIYLQIIQTQFSTTYDFILQYII